MYTPEQRKQMQERGTPDTDRDDCTDQTALFDAAIRAMSAPTDYEDIQYHGGTLRVPKGHERHCARIGDEVICCGDVVRYTLYDVMVVINRIVWHKRVANDRDWSFYQFDYEVIDFNHKLYSFCANDVAENFEVVPSRCGFEILV